MKYAMRYLLGTLTIVAVPGLIYAASLIAPSLLSQVRQDEEKQSPAPKSDSFVRALENASKWSLAKQANSRFFGPLSMFSSFRLLRIRPGAYGDPLSCDLITQSLPAETPFEAISYCWTKALPEAVIEEGELAGFKITKHVKFVLHRLRNEDTDRIVWLDAICINQEDLHERSCQVRVMRQIFTSADSVIVWLGEGSFAPAEEDSVPAEEITAGTRGINAGKAEVRYVNEIAAHSTDAWWQRVWVYQEVAVAKRVHILLGKKLMPWQRFLSTLERECNVVENRELLGPAQTAQLQRTLTCLHAINDIRAKSQVPDSRYPLSQLLLATSNVSASLKEDKIYALLGLAGHEYSQDIILQYARNIDLLLLETLHCMLRIEGSVDILVSGWPVLHSLGLSWLPDLTSTNKKEEPLLSSFRYHASRMSKSTTSLTTASNASQPVKIHAGVFENYRPTLKNLQTLRLVIKGVLVDYIRISQEVKDINCRRVSGSKPKAEWHEYTLRCPGNGFQRLMREIPTQSPAGAWAYDGWIPSSSSLDRSAEKAATTAVPVAEEVVDSILRLSMGTARTVFNNPNCMSTSMNDDYQFWSQDAALDDRLSGDLTECSIFITKESRVIGIGPRSIRQNDCIVVPFGARVPFVLRPMGTEYKLIGPAYVQAAMYGEVINLHDVCPDNFPVGDFVLR